MKVELSNYHSTPVPPERDLNLPLNTLGYTPIPPDADYSFPNKGFNSDFNHTNLTKVERSHYHSTPIPPERDLNLSINVS